MMTVFVKVFICLSASLFELSNIGEKLHFGSSNKSSCRRTWEWMVIQ
jgi:hypothetical protein